MKRPRPEYVSLAYEAQLAGDCLLCPKPIELGQRVRRLRFGDGETMLVHEDCAEREMKRR